MQDGDNSSTSSEADRDSADEDEEEQEEVESTDEYLIAKVSIACTARPQLSGFDLRRHSQASLV